MNEKVVRCWPHMQNQVLEVPGRTPPSAKLRMAPSLWAHFVDLYLGLGSWRLKGNEKPEELRERAIRALESSWPMFSKLPEAYREPTMMGSAFMIRMDPTMPPLRVAFGRSSTTRSVFMGRR